MIVLRDPAQLVTDQPIVVCLSKALEQCFQDISDDGFYDPDEHGYIVIAEPGDTVEALETEAGCPIFTDWFGGSRYPDPDYSPPFEYLEECAVYYELVFIINDGGFAVLLFVPKLTGIDTQLLSMCRENA